MGSLKSTVEFIIDIFPIGGELILSMREGKLDGSSGPVPGRRPLRGSCDFLRNSR